jgi:hypothetical protein
MQKSGINQQKILFGAVLIVMLTDKTATRNLWFQIIIIFVLVNLGSCQVRNYLYTWGDMINYQGDVLKFISV